MTARGIITAALGAGILALLAVVAAVQVTGDPVAMFSRDLRALSDAAGADLPFYAGSLSILNGWVWASAAALALVAGLLVPWRRRWMGLFAALLLAIAADDALMLHESVGPDHGVPERAFFALYAAGGSVLLLTARRRWREHTVVAFVAGAGFLALSIGVDLVVPDNFLVEDGAKLLGALMWLTVPVLALGDLQGARRPQERRTPAGADHPRAAPPGPRSTGDDGDEPGVRWAARLVSAPLVR